MFKGLGAPSRLQYIIQFHNVPVAAHSAQYLDFSEQTFGIGMIVENIAYFLNCDILVGGYMLGEYNCAIAALSNFPL
jgi:hypothetical protein